MEFQCQLLPQLKTTTACWPGGITHSVFYSEDMKPQSYQLLCCGDVVVTDEQLQAGELPFFHLYILCSCLPLLWVERLPSVWLRR